MVWFERKVIAGMQNRIGPEQGRPVRHAADARRRHQAVLQGGPAPRPRRPLRVPAGAVPRLRAGVPRVVASSRSAATSATATTASSTWFGHETRVQLADPPIGILLRARAVVDRRLRHHARRLVERLEVPAARLGAGVGADGQLRGGARAQPGRRAARRRHAVDERHRRRPGRASPTGTSSPPAFVPFVDLHDRRDGRAEPPAVRPRRGRAGARRRVQHRVLEHPASRCSSSPSS